MSQTKEFLAAFNNTTCIRVFGAKVGALNFIYAEDSNTDFIAYTDYCESNKKKISAYNNWDKLESDLKKLNSEGADIYFIVNHGGHTKDDITKITSYFADWDAGRNIDGTYKNIEEVEKLKKEYMTTFAGMLKNKELPVPSIITETRNGYHFYWLNKAESDLDKFTPIQTAIAKKLKSDMAVKDLPRVMRMPNFLWQKKGEGLEPYLCSIKFFNPSVRYTQEQICSYLTLEEETTGTKTTCSSRVPTGTYYIKFAGKKIIEVSAFYESGQIHAKCPFCADTKGHDIVIRTKGGSYIAYCNRCKAGGFATQNKNDLYEYQNKEKYQKEDKDIITQFANAEDDTIVNVINSIYDNRDFPIDALPAIVRDYGIAKESITNTHTEYHCISLMAGFAALLQAQYKMKVFDGWWAYPSCSFIIVGDTGESKTHPQKQALKGLYAFNKQEISRYQEELLNYDKWKDRRRKKGNDEPYKEPPKRLPYILNKFTLEGLRDNLKDNPKGLLLHIDELDGLFKSLNQYKGGSGDDLTALMAALDGEDLNLALASKSIFISKPRVSLIGSIQRKVIKKCFTEDTKDLGFAYRFLFVNPDTQKYFKFKNIDATVLAKIEERIEDIYLNIHNEISVLDKEIFWDSPEVAQIFYNFNNDYMMELREKYILNDDLKAVLSKILSFTPKIAMLLQLIKYYANETNNTNIEYKTMEQTIKLMKYYIYQNYTLLNTSGIENIDSSYHYFLNYVIKHKVKNGELTIREIVQKRKNGYMTTEQVKNKVEKLIDAKKAEWINDKKTAFKMLENI